MVTLEVYPKNHHKRQHNSVPIFYAALGMAPHYSYLCLISLLPFLYWLPFYLSVCSLPHCLESLPSLQVLTLRVFQVPDPSPLLFPYVIPSQGQGLGPRPFPQLPREFMSHPHHLAGPQSQ